ncbi:hypothetical protein M0811_08345 [Anaeramoeba ignava]|uniref:Uncharacterized protein n=1 Tax=Anaeramoeba ignava TaxID=1746090 RepID=A0A9Q0RB49_ANAIG|nr:hypothetical protein M0811_08345 [Anaeramoeba ignava]|eukprot:Anaeramoba_ignava/a91294_33.p1 GENE.a91294_33~~a91294_33.p1  ORF type:complete len:183 (-),score=61.99 a91294_33:6-554(-)
MKRKHFPISFKEEDFPKQEKNRKESINALDQEINSKIKENIEKETKKTTQQKKPELLPDSILEELNKYNPTALEEKNSDQNQLKNEEKNRSTQVLKKSQKIRKLRKKVNQQIRKNELRNLKLVILPQNPYKNKHSKSQIENYNKKLNDYFFSSKFQRDSVSRRIGQRKQGPALRFNSSSHKF